MVVDGNVPKAEELFDRELVGQHANSQAARVTLGIDGAIGHAPDVMFGSTGALANGTFVYPDGHGHFCAVDPGALSVDPGLRAELRLCCPEYSANVLLEWIILPLAFMPLAADGWVPLHASGVADDELGGAVVFAAWSGVGKTNMLLARLRSGALGTYLGDDAVLVNADGTALPSSRTVSAYGYNEPLLTGLSPATRARMFVGRKVRSWASRAGPRGGRVKTFLRYAANAYSNTRVDLPRARNEDAFRPQPVVKHVRASAATRLNLPELVATEPPPPAAAAAAHLAVLEYEHIQFQRLVDTWRWATTADADPWSGLVERWRKNLNEYFACERTYADLRLPHPVYAADSLELIWGQLRQPSGA